MTEKERQASRLLDNFLKHRFFGKEIEPADIDVLGDMVRCLLGLKDEPEIARAVKSSLLSLSGRLLDEARAEQLAFRLAFGKELLAGGKAVAEYNFSPGCAELECISAYMEPAPSPRINLMFKVLSGGLVGSIRSFSCHPGSFQRLSKMAGIAKRKWRRFHPREIVGMHFLAFLMRDGRGDIVLDRIFTIKKIRSRNARLRRKREKDRVCSEEKQCIYCEKSFEECPLGTHSEAWELKDCPNGHRSYFVGDKCLFCTEEEFKKRANIFTFGEDDLY